MWYQIRLELDNDGILLVTAPVVAANKVRRTLLKRENDN